MKLIIIDTETTGLDYKLDSITEIGGIVKIDGKIKEKFIFKNDLYNNFIKLLNKYCSKYDKTDKFYFVAYNAHFDMNFIRELFLKNGNVYYGSYFYNPCIDILQLVAYKLMGKKKQPENFKLGTIAKFYGINCNENQLHTAYYDAFLANEILKKVRK